MDIQGLKDKILQLEIQGKLVDQDKNDEPASVLLERIKEERDKLVKEKKIRKQNQLPEVTDEEKPFEIPESWEWVRVEDLVKFKIDNRGKTPSHYKEKKEGLIDLLEINSLIPYGGVNRLKVEKFVDIETFKTAFRSGHPKKGDILIAYCRKCREIFNNG